MAYQVETVDRGGRKVYILTNGANGATASILPSFGFNLFDLRLPVRGHLQRVIIADEGWESNPKDAGRNGIPILFPFPNRIKDATYGFGGKTYTLPANNGKNAIHGFAIDAPWDVVESKATETEAYISGRYQLSVHSPKSRELWPTDAVLQVKYSLSGQTLGMEVTVTNPTADPLPWGFGIHPYFRLPMVKGTPLHLGRVLLPASKFWPLADFVPTGEVKAVDPRLDFRNGQPMLGLKLDDVLTGLTFEKDHGIARLVDMKSGGEIKIEYDRMIRELVVYTPPGDGDIISIEPYTQTTDAINLESRKIEGGLKILEHGQSAKLKISISTADLPKVSSGRQ